MSWYEEEQIAHFAHFLLTVWPEQHSDALATYVPKGAHEHNPLVSVEEHH